MACTQAESFCGTLYPIFERLHSSQEMYSFWHRLASSCTCKADGKKPTELEVKLQSALGLWPTLVVFFKSLIPLLQNIIFV
jgi:hypothetical protein